MALGTVNTPARVAVPKVNGKIAFSSTRDCNEETCVTDSSPAWSPDNNRMVFDSKRGADTEIFVMDATGDSRDQLTTNSSSTADFEPAWQPRP
jgi:WD40-like Beta Propeller Repeat